jgi:hypothetical protein
MSDQKNLDLLVASPFASSDLKFLMEDASDFPMHFHICIPSNVEFPLADDQNKSYHSLTTPSEEALKQSPQT